MLKKALFLFKPNYISVMHPSSWSLMRNNSVMWHLLEFMIRGFPFGSVVNNLPAVQRRRFNLWVGKIPWSRIWKPAPVFLPGKSHRQRSLAGYSPWGHKRDRHDWTTGQQYNLWSQTSKDQPAQPSNHIILQFIYFPTHSNYFTSYSPFSNTCTLSNFSFTTNSLISLI